MSAPSEFVMDDSFEVVSEPQKIVEPEDQTVTSQAFFGEGLQQNMTSQEFFGEGEVNIHEPEEEEKLGFAQRFGRDIEKRAEVDREIKAAYEAGEIGTAEALLQMVGKTGFGSVLDFLGEVTVSAGRGIAEVAKIQARGLSAITPDIIEKPLIDGATAAAHFFLNSQVAQLGLKAARKGMEEWSEFKEENPRAARNIEAVVNIGLLITPVKGKPPKGITKIGKAAQVLEEKVAKQIFTKRQDFIDDLIRPKQTAAVKKEQVSRTVEEGILRTKEVALSSSEKRIAGEVANIPDVKRAKTLQGNHNAISKEVTKEANKLKTSLAENDVVFTRKEFNAKLDEALVRLGDNPLLVGDAQKTAEKVVKKMTQIVAGKKSTASNLLKARKELDTWIKSQKGTNIFDPKQESALSIAIREVRNTTNDFIATKAKSTAVKASLNKQSTLLRAMDNIGPKAAEEASNAVLRAWQSVQRILPLRGEFNQSMAVIFGVGGLGASAIFAPFFTKIVLGTIASYALGKAIMGPKVKKGLSMLLKAMDKAIVTTRDKQLIKQMRLDRAAILELLKITKEKLKEVDNESKTSKVNY